MTGESWGRHPEKQAHSGLVPEAHRRTVVKRHQQESLGKEVQVIAKPKNGAGGLSSLRPLPKLLLEVMPITGQHSDGRDVLCGR